MDWESKLIDYINNELSAEDRKTVEHELAKNPDLRSTWQEFINLKEQVNTIDFPETSSKLQMNFDSFLEREIQRQNKAQSSLSFKSVWKYAAAIVLLASVGIFWFTNREKDAPTPIVLDAETQDAFITLVSESSVSTRIQGIQSTYEMGQLDNNIQQTLLKLILEDESPNVRIAAVQALGDLNIQVDISLLLKALETEAVPTVQIALIDALVKLKGKDAGPVLDQLSVKPELPKVVKSEAELRKFMVNTL